jgi:hypothetical protein
MSSRSFANPTGACDRQMRICGGPARVASPFNAPRADVGDYEIGI